MRPAQRVAALAASSIASQLMTLVVMVVLAWLLPRPEYGSYGQLLLLSSLVSLLFVAALPASLLFFVPTAQKDQQAGLVWRTALLAATIGVAAAACLWFARGPVAALFNNPDLVDLVGRFIPYISASIAVSPVISAMVALGRVRDVIPLMLGSAALTLCALGAVLLLGGEIRTVVLAFSLAKAAEWAIGMALLARVAGRPRRIPLDLAIPAQLRYALPLGLTGILGTLAWELDKIVVSSQFAPAMYAIYTVGATEVPFINALSGAVNSVLVPEIAALDRQGDRGRILALWHAATRKLSLVYFPLFVFLMLVADLLIPLVFSDRYRDSVPLFQIYLLLMPLRVASYGLLFQATGRTDYNLRGIVLFLVVNLALTIGFVRAFGMWGAAAATVLATIVLIAYYLACLNRVFAFPLGDLLPWRILAGNAVPAVLAGAVTVPVLWSGAMPILKLGGAALVFTAAYVGLALRLRRFQLSELKSLASSSP